MASSVATVVTSIASSICCLFPACAAQVSQSPGFPVLSLGGWEQSLVSNVKRRQLIAPQTARSLKSGRSGRGLRQRYFTFWSIGFLIHEVAVTIPTSQCCLDNYACESHMGRYFVNYENHYCHNHANIWIGACENSLYISLWNVPV